MTCREDCRCTPCRMEARAARLRRLAGELEQTALALRKRLHNGRRTLPIGSRP